MTAPAFDLHVAGKSGKKSTLRRSGDEGAYTFGRGYNFDSADPAAIMIPDEMVSRVHCSLTWSDDRGWMLTDLASTNGTFVNGHSITASVPLQSGDTFRIGGSVVRVEFDTRSDFKGDETIILPDRSVGGGVDEETVVVGSPDRTVVAESPDPTLLADGGNEVIEVAANEATLIADHLDETILAGDRSSSVALDEDGQSHTVLAPQDSETVVARSDDEQTVVQGSSGESAGRGREDATIPFGTEEVREMTEILVSSPSPIDAAPTSLVTNNETPLAAHAAVVGSQNSELIQNLIDANLVRPEQAQQYVARARESGQTFFFEMVNDRTGDDNRKLYQWISKDIHCDLIEDAATLQNMLPEPVEWLTPSVAEKRKALILDDDRNGGVKYGTTDPFDIVTRDWVERRTGQNAEIVAVLPTVFREVIGRLRIGQDDDGEGDRSAIPIMFTFDEEQEFRDELDTQEVPRIVEYFMHRAYVQRASDIHVEPTETGLLVRNRVDGMLHDECQLPPSIRRAVTSRIKILANMDVAEKRRPQDGRISVVINKAPIDIRASSYPTVHGEKIVMRLLDRSSLSPRPDDLGLMHKDLRKLLDKINAPLGLIMLSGPTGSGKTTTLYSCLGSIDRRTKNVLTVEDPVEYRLEGVHQMQVNEKIGVTFAAGLRTILRQDPDVVMVGECRDEETANMAIQASLTGHIVFSTIHANDSIGVVTRLLDMNIDPFLVSSAITLAIAQRLVRTVCRSCSTDSVTGDIILQRLREDGVSDEKLKNLGIEIDPDLEYVNPTGCHACRDTGYSGRRPVFEVFEMTNECRRIVMSNDFDPGELKRIAQRNGMTTLVEHALTLIEDGITTHAEIIRVLGENDI